MAMLLSLFLMLNWNGTEKEFVLKIQIVYTIHTMEEKMIVTHIYVFSYQICPATLKSVKIVLLLFQIARIPHTSPASSQSIITKLYMIPMYSPTLMLVSMSHFHLRQALGVEQQ